MVGGVKVLILLLVVVCVGCGTTSSPTKTAKKPPIADPILREAVRVSLAKFHSEFLADTIGPNLEVIPWELSKWHLDQVHTLDFFEHGLTELPKGLEKLPRLQYLNLSINKLTDLKGLEKLSYRGFGELRLFNNPDLTKAQIAELQKALPKCDIRSNPTK